MAYRSFQFLEFEVRGVRKVTTGEHFFAESVAHYYYKIVISIFAYMTFFYYLFTTIKGITGLWQPSVHSDVAF